MHRLEDAGRCQVLYADESGFCLQPPVPYLWQRRGQSLGLPSQAHSRRLSVLGLVSRRGHLHSFATQEKITAPFVIESVEALLPALTRPTVLVLDNATVHRSKQVQAKRREWKAKGLRLLFLPPYCPHLNKIENAVADGQASVAGARGISRFCDPLPERHQHSESGRNQIHDFFCMTT